MKPEKPDHIAQKDWDEVDSPELTDDFFAQAKPFQEVFPAEFEAWKRGKGRPKAAKPKEMIGFRWSADVVSAVKSVGKGYNARVEKLVRDAIAQGKL